MLRDSEGVCRSWHLFFLSACQLSAFIAQRKMQ
jgi:hypothetical protein